MNLIIRHFIMLSFLLIGFVVFPQQKPKMDEIPTETIAPKKSKPRPRLLSLALDTYLPIPTGDKYVGKGMEGKLSFNFKAQLFIYRQTFLKLGLGESYFEVIDPSVTGSYEKTTVSNQYLSLGYEFLPFDNLRLGVSVGVLGSADYLNKKFIDGKDRALQQDTAKLNIYELYIDYEFKSFMAVTFNYSYRNDKTNISVPQELQSTFDRAQFHTVGIGLKFYIGDNNLFYSK